MISIVILVPLVVIGIALILAVAYLGFRGLWEEGKPTKFRVKGLPAPWNDPSRLRIRPKDPDE